MPRRRGRRDHLTPALAAERGTLTGALRVDIEAAAPDRRPRDLDNLLKVPLDALQAAGVYADDRQIAEPHVTRLPPCDDPHLRITITPIQSQAGTHRETRILGEGSDQGSADCAPPGASPAADSCGHPGRLYHLHLNGIGRLPCAVRRGKFRTVTKCPRDTPQHATLQQRLLRPIYS